VRVAVVCLAVGCAFRPTPVGQAAPNDAHADALTSAQIDAPPDALPSDLVAWYPMDSLPTMIDATGNGHDGSCSACPTLGSGVIGSGYAFASERFNVPSVPTLQTGSGTAAAWVVFDTLPTGYACPFGMVYDMPANNDTWQLCRNAAEWSVFLHTSASASNITEIDDPSAILAGQWHYVAIVWTPNQCALYVDGALGVGSAISPLQFDATGPLTVGADTLTNGNIDVPMTGRLDELKIFNRDLSADEIVKLMQQR
jgi:hypothetical protein